MDDKSFTIRVPKRFVRIGLIVGVTALVVAPLTAVAAHVFNDVPESHTFHNDIAWLADAGVTRGCNPPDNTEFCPEDNVTRGQMGAFMKRFAQYIDAEDGTPGQADNADQLDGKDGPAYETVVAAASCGVTMSSGGDLATTCIPSSDGSVGPATNAEVLEVTIEAPAAGALQISSSGIVEGVEDDPSLAFQARMESSCPSDPNAVVNGALNNQIWGNVVGYGTAASLTTSVSAGTHTVRLCGFNVEGTPAQLAAATLNLQWTAGGSVEVASGSASSIDAPAILDN